MYFIAVYDVGQKRVTRMLKLMREYLHHVQNSVFEGQLTKAQAIELKYRAEKIMDTTYDSLILYQIANQKWIDRDVIGQDKNNADNML